MKKLPLTALVALWSVFTLKVRAGHNPRCSCNRKVRNEDSGRRLKKVVSVNNTGSSDGQPTETPNFGNESYAELEWTPDTFDWGNVGDRSFLVSSW